MQKTAYKVIEKRNLWLCLSLAIILPGLFMMVMRWCQAQPILNYGIDFIGGTTISLRLDPSTRATMTDSQIIQKIREGIGNQDPESTGIQISDQNEVLIKTSLMDSDKSSHLIESLQKKIGNVEVLEVDFIGPSMGSELRKQSMLIAIFITLALLGYITWRFEFAYGVGVLVATVHDALVIIGMGSLLHMEINATFIAALLTILGYSINDTIIIFDRIRENIKKAGRKLNLLPLTNDSLSQCIVRTINTSLSTLIVITCLLIFGGSTIREFCLVLLIGILAGTYSSFFVASPVFFMIRNQQEEKKTQPVA